MKDKIDVFDKKKQTIHKEINNKTIAFDIMGDPSTIEKEKLWQFSWEKDDVLGLVLLLFSFQDFRTNSRNGQMVIKLLFCLARVILQN